jgi:beta-galactosidase
MLPLHIVLLSSLLVTAAPAKAAARIRLDISEDWQFLLADDPGTENSDFTSRLGWVTVRLPHTWNTGDTFDDVPGYYRGAAWYRKEFDVPAEWRGKHLFLRFEAAAQVATVWVNNTLVGEHKGAFTPFEFDITQLVRQGSRNLVSVRVDKRNDRCCHARAA